MHELPVEDRAHARLVEDRVADAVVAVHERDARRLGRALGEPALGEIEHRVRLDGEIADPLRGLRELRARGRDDPPAVARRPRDRATRGRARGSSRGSRRALPPCRRASSRRRRRAAGVAAASRPRCGPSGRTATRGSRGRSCPSAAAAPARRPRTPRAAHRARRRGRRRRRRGRRDPGARRAAALRARRRARSRGPPTRSRAKRRPRAGAGSRRARTPGARPSSRATKSAMRVAMTSVFDPVASCAPIGARSPRESGGVARPDRRSGRGPDG